MKNGLSVNIRESEYSSFDESENINKSGNISPSVNVALSWNIYHKLKPGVIFLLENQTN